MKNEQMLSVAEVCELPAGDADNATWINPGFTATVLTITKKETKAGKSFWPCILQDTTGSAKIEVSFFTAPRFDEGDVITISGQGLRRTEYQGKPQAAIGQKTEVHVTEKGTGRKSAPLAERREQPQDRAPAASGAAQPVNGQTVGMAMKEALALLTSDGTLALDTPEFWAAVHRTASDIIRVSQLLEKGKLAPSVKDRTSPPPKAAAKPAPEIDPEDVPY